MTDQTPSEQVQPASVLHPLFEDAAARAREDGYAEVAIPSGTYDLGYRADWREVLESLPDATVTLDGPFAGPVDLRILDAEPQPEDDDA